MVWQVPNWLTYDFPPAVKAKVNRLWGGEWHGQAQKWFVSPFFPFLFLSTTRSLLGGLFFPMPSKFVNVLVKIFEVCFITLSYSFDVRVRVLFLHPSFYKYSVECLFKIKVVFKLWSVQSTNIWPFLSPSPCAKCARNLCF